MWEVIFIGSIKSVWGYNNTSVWPTHFWPNPKIVEKYIFGFHQIIFRIWPYAPMWFAHVVGCTDCRSWFDVMWFAHVQLWYLNFLIKAAFIIKADLKKYINLIKTAFMIKAALIQSKSGFYHKSCFLRPAFIIKAGPKWS